MADRKFIKIYQFFDERNLAYRNAMKNYEKGQTLNKSAIYRAWKQGACNRLQTRIMLAHNETNQMEIR